MVRVLSASSKGEKDRAVSDCLISLRGLRREMATIRETLDEAETSMMSHADFETLLFTLEKEAGEEAITPQFGSQPPGPIAMKLDKDGEDHSFNPIPDTLPNPVDTSLGRVGEDHETFMDDSGSTSSKRDEEK